MRVLVCLLLVLSPTLFAALTSQHGEAVAAPELAVPATTPAARPTPPERKAEHQLQQTAPVDPSRADSVHSTR